MPGSSLLLSPAVTATSATGASGAGVTLTIAAAPAGLFLHLVLLEIDMFAVALLTAGVTPVLVTSTGITGTPTFSFDASAQAQGIIISRIYQFGGNPLKGSAAATAITIVCPATTNVIWRVNGFSFVAP